MPPELRKRRPAPGMWSAHEHAVHLPAIYPLMIRRLDLMLSDPRPYIKSYEPSRDDPDGALLKLDLDAEMDRFDRDRAVLIARLGTLTPEQWAITAGHEEYATTASSSCFATSRCTTCTTRTKSKTGCCAKSGLKKSGTILIGTIDVVWRPVFRVVFDRPELSGQQAHHV